MKDLKMNTEALFPAIKEVLLDFQKLFDSYGIQLKPQQTYEFSSKEIDDATWLSLNYLICLDNSTSGYFIRLSLSPTGFIIIDISSSHWWIGGKYRSVKTTAIPLSDEVEIKRILAGMPTILAFNKDGELQANNMQALFNNKELVC